MNEIQKEVKNYVIVFKDRSNVFITEKQYNNIMSECVEQKSEISKIDVNGQGYDLNSISKLLSIKQYYEQYPDKRPQTYNNPIIEHNKPSLSYSRKIKATMLGMERFVNEYGWENISSSTKEMIIKWRQKVKALN